MKRKLTLTEINDIIKDEDNCGVQNLIAIILSNENASKGLDVIVEITIKNNKEYIGEYEVIKGKTLKVK